MIGILKFRLPAEENDFKLAQRAVDYFSTLYNFQQWLRNRDKYTPLSEEAKKELQEIRRYFNENCPNLDDIE